MGTLIRKKGKSFRVEVHHLARIPLTVAFAFLLQFLLDLTLNLCQSFDAVGKTLLLLVSALVDAEVVVSASVNDLVYSGSGDTVRTFKISDPLLRAPVVVR